jgi:hypothetical protein
MLLKKLGLLSVQTMAIAGLLFAAGCGGGGGGHVTPPTLTGLSIYPGSVTVAQTQTVQLTAYMGAATTAATWSVTSGTGTISSTGLFTAPGTSETDTIQATAGSNGGTATIIVSGGAPPVLITPSAVAVPAGAQTQFSTTTAGVTWTVNGNGGDAVHGFINGTTGLYVAPLTPPPTGSVTISASAGGNSGTATATIVFSNASLNSYVSPFSAGSPQPYAFAYTGDDGSGFLAVAGSFVADGNGNIVGGVEDVNSGFSVPTTTPITASTYTVGPDGRTTANITTGLGSGIVWQFTLISNAHALLVRFDQNATGSGTIDIQDPNQFNNPLSLSTYAFSVSGLDFNAFPLGVVGRFFGSAGTIPLNNAVLDLNDGGSSATDALVSGGYAIDITNPGTGRGTLSLDCPTFDTDFGNGTAGSGTVVFVFYIVDATHLKIVEGDTTVLLTGDVYSAPSTPVNLNTSAFVLGGSDNNGSAVGIGGVFVTSGGTGSGGLLDINDNGGHSPNGEAITSTSASLNTTTGRIGVTITDANTTEFTFAAYSFNYTALNGSAATGAVMLEDDDNVTVTSGVAYTQTSTSTPQGSFALNLTGVASTGGEQDIAGQFTTGANGALTGTLDVNNAANTGAVVSSVPLNTGSIITTVGSNGRGNPLTLATKFPKFILSYYVIDQNTALLLEMDGSRVTVGSIGQQF